MMKTIYLDTEFSEGFFKPIGWLPKWLPGNKPRWSIEFISIGLVDGQGKEYYAINKHYKRSRCNDWVKANVLTKLPERMDICDDDEDYYQGTTDYGMCSLKPNPLYKSIEEIRRDIINFVAPASAVFAKCEETNEFSDCLRFYLKNHPIQFKAYYADYDWVMLCTIFGTMMDLPDGFPRYCVDIKQTFDEVALLILKERQEEKDENATKKSLLTKLFDFSDGYELTIRGTHKMLKAMKSYPKQHDSDSHNALNDAKWNMELDEWLTLQKAFL